MKFSIAVFSAPHAASSRRALRFVEAAIAQGHEVVRLFFYKEGVMNAAEGVVTPQDELDLPAAWQTLIRAHELDAVVCIAAALRRGVLNEEEARRYQRRSVATGTPWVLSGLGQLHEANQAADRLICFGGP